MIYTNEYAPISVNSNIMSEAILYLSKCGNKRDFKT